MPTTTLANESQDRPAASDPSAADDTLLVAATHLTQEQRTALEVAESARDDAGPGTSFAAGLLLGRPDHALLRPFPEQDRADAAIGNDLVTRVSSFLAAHLDPDAVDESRTIPPEVIAGLRELGVLRMKVPKEYGGLGLSQVNYNRVVQAIASYCASTAVLVSAHQSIGVPQPLKLFGTEEQKRRYLPRISRGELTAFALTEPGVGSDPAKMETTAVPVEDGSAYILNGEKLWTTNGPIAGLLVVMARTPPKVSRGREKRQITAFLVETDTPGVEVTHRCDFMGLRAIQNGLIRFTNVRVPAENLLWGEGRGLKLALRTLNTGRLTLPAACAGIGKQCLAIMRAWGNDREQWGLPVGRHEFGQAKIAECAATTFAMEAVTWLTSHWADEGREIRIEAAMAKLFCSEASWRLVDLTMQFRGGRGYERATSLEARGEEPVPVERMMRDCRINTIIEGTSEIMRLFLAREALDPHLRLAADLLRPGAPVGRKTRAVARLLAFYGRWYPARLLGGWRPWGFHGEGSLRKHLRYQHRASNRVARALFHAMGRHQARLERRQVLLGHLMDIATELFAMAAACAYARSAVGDTVGRGGSGDGPERMADLFCRQARGRIEQHFVALGSRDGKATAAVAEGVSAGRYRWLERGIIEPRRAAAGAPQTEPEDTNTEGRNGLSRFT